MAKPPPENTCAWCGEFIDEDVKIHAIGAKFPQDVDMKDHEGMVIFLGFNDIDKKVPAIIPTSDSEAKKRGHELMFMTCSQICYNKLKSTLDKENDLYDVKQL